MANYLSNHWNDVTLMKLDPDHGDSGPFVVIQDAIDPNDPGNGKRIWMLRADGKWIDQVVHHAQPREKRERVWFESVAEVMALMAKLPAHPVVESMPLTAEETATSYEDIAQLNLEVIREHVKEWKDAHRH